MPLPNPSHLFEQAERLATPILGGPRDTDLRRSISSAYYGLFHVVAAAAADNWARANNQTSPEYSLAYRHLDHRRLKSICNAAKGKLPKDYGHLAGHKFGSDLRRIAEIIVELQELRHGADYDPLFQIGILNARLAIVRAKTAADLFWHHVLPDEKLVFLSLVMFKQR